MPVSIGVQWPDIDSARSCARGDLHLTYCDSCGFIWNRSFDESRLEYSQKYDNSLDFSPVFQTYAEGLADRLIETYSISGKRVVELGCGKGHFLSLLCERGENTGIGFDPSYEGERVDSAVADRIEYVQDFYGEKYTDHPGDLVCCRHVLEHIKNPFEFLASVRKTVGGNKNTIVYFEVPNVRLILERLSVWDIIYEHCNYFSRESLVNLFQRAGFEVLRVEETYEKQFLSIDCRLSSEDTNSQATPVPIDDLSGLVNRFSAEMKGRVGSWHKRLEEFEKDGKKVAIWGAGAKTVGFVNMLQIGDRIPAAVDINPHKQGLHLAGMGQKIVSPNQLKIEQPDVVIVMNPIYTAEIKSQLDSMGLSPEIIEA